jgi:hypothetical protein
MKKLILTSATVLFLGLTAMACEGDKCGKKCEKKCDKQECTKGGACKKDGKNKECKMDDKACKHDKASCEKKCDNKGAKTEVKPEVKPAN